MAAQILQIDLAQPLPTIRTLPRYRHLWILVRFGRQPLGWVRCRPRQFRRKIEPDLLAQLIAETLYLQVHDAVRLRSFEPAPPARTPLISIVICTRDHPAALERQLR